MSGILRFAFQIWNPLTQTHSLESSSSLKMLMLLVTLAISLLFAAFLFISRLKKLDNAKSLPANSTHHKASNSYTRSEITMHNKRTDCWIIIKDKVYDVTSYVEEHPGGDAILDHAGDDSTEGFFGPQHATRVFDMIEDFYIGDLKQ